MIAQASGKVIPLYEYPSLGGNNTMRGYTMNRWRDRSAALIDLEYRMPTPVPMLKGLDTVIFFETGKVGGELTKLGLDNWSSDAGLGIHINFGGNVIVRADFGHGTEGTNAYFFYNQAF
jgi:hemolysin activation/secretion protein